MLAVPLVLCGCNKTTNNNNTTVQPTPVAAYTVDGLVDFAVSSSASHAWNTAVYMPITVTYHDSAQSPVQISISNLPTGVNVASVTSGYLSSYGPWTGTPTFSLSLAFWTNWPGPTNGTYPVTMTAKNVSTGATKTFQFNLEIKS